MTESPAKKTPPKPPKPPFAWFGLRTYLTDDPFALDQVPNEAEDIARFRRMARILGYQALAIAVLIAALIFTAPLMQPFQHYFSLNPEKQLRPLVPLSEPNLTNQAILSWTATAVTEIMTVGFGDFDKQILSQRWRFTSDGWDSFLEALFRQGVRDAFRERQLVLTTVPADMPVITAQGLGPDERYLWRVELPIIMTYTTNNNVTKRERSIIQLTLVRVPSHENIGGLGIKSWRLAS